MSLKRTFAAILACAVLSAQTPGVPQPSDPFVVDADHLEVLQDRNMALITGNVVIVRAGTTLRADLVRGFFTDRGAGRSAAQFRAMEAEGRVRYETGDERITSRRARYDASDETITFEEDVTVTRGRDVLNGCRLVYFLKMRESKLEACAAEAQAGGRVRGVFFPEDPDGEDDDPQG